MVSIIELGILYLLGFFLSYLLLLSILALFVPVRSSVQIHRKRKFACVVPAHNEERNIAKTVSNLKSIDYPRELYDVVVIADNCTDDTASVAWHSGAMVMERSDKKKKGKGHALQWAFEQLQKSPVGYEGYVVIDADSVVSKNFLQVMNWYLEQGNGSIQSADLVAPNPGAWSSEVSRISLTLYNYVRPLGRKALNCSAGLRGNGMCFSADTLKQVPWQAHSLTEDLEYGLILLQHGISTAFAPEANVWATMPAKSKNAESQRARWEGGRLPIVKKYAPELFRSAVKEMSWKKADALIDLLTPAFVNMVAVILFVIGIKYFGEYVAQMQSGIPLGGWLLLFIISISYVLIGLIAAKADPALCKAVIYFPVYLLWKLRLYGKLLITGITKEWVRTVREH
ncbi:MAG: glycosyltransferase [Ignavibacteriales bacterium]|nr:glycosyltransferase [Ignavibacteriales bacterium]